MSSLRAWRWIPVIGLLFAILLPAPRSNAEPSGPQFKSVDIGKGVVLHYAEAGTGIPVVFVHGSLSDYEYWQQQVGPFAQHYRVIAYSRRYNVPNDNAAIAGYSARVDADDLTALIATLHLGRVYVVGHSYGALAALILEIRHPERLRAVVLAEPPDVSLLQHLLPPNAKKGKAMYADIEANMVLPMQREFSDGNTSAGVGTFIDYVFRDPAAWQKFSPADRADTLKNAREWDVMLPKGTLFPDIPPASIRAIHVPTLIMSGAKSYPFLALIDNELARLIPRSRHIVFPDAGHQMWLKHPDDCRDLTEHFFAEHAR